MDKSRSLSEQITKIHVFFHIMQIDSSFLLENPASWRSLNSYQSGLKNTGAVNVVYDCTERVVTLGADFAPHARSEDHYQNLLQVVKDDRRYLQKIRKNV